MNNERDMYYGGYGYGYIPANMIPAQNLNPYTSSQNFNTNQINDINEKINRLERQIKRLDQRLTRLETPYANNNYNEPENNNNMYIM